MTNIILADDTGGVIDVLPLWSESQIIELSEEVSEVLICWKDTQLSKIK